jgi:L-aminopeptidase/D-esterase-like protein
MKLINSITDIPGIRVGHAHDFEALTGCTVILCDGGATGGVDQRGGAPGTRETDAMHPLHIVNQVHAVVLTGGSAFGLDSAAGVVRYLEERGVGFDTRVAKVPIVPAAVLFDLSLGRADVRPGPEMGYQACENASTDPPGEGNIGAGTGATVGKILGMSQAMKSGIGTASEHIGRGVIVAAIAAVNALGDVIDPQTNQIVAGARSIHKGPLHIGQPGYFADTLQVLRTLVGRATMRFAAPKGNTVIGVVATNARLNKEQVTKVSQMAHDGIARTIRPAHTMFDGDTVFTLATGERRADVNIVGAFGAEVFARAILRAVRAAQPVANLPAASEAAD